MQANNHHKAMIPSVQNFENLEHNLSEFDLLLDCNNQLISLLQDIDCGHVKADSGLMHYIQAILHKHIEGEYQVLCNIIRELDAKAKATQAEQEKGGLNERA